MNKSYYVDGSAVRELDPERRKRRGLSVKEKEAIRRKRNRKKAAKRNRERALYMSKSYVAFLTLCVALSVFSAVTYVRLQAEATVSLRHIASLESNISETKADNDARYKSVSTSVDLNHIKDVAINELGMSYATEDQIVYYTVDNNNFMDQYNDIPEK